MARGDDEAGERLETSETTAELTVPSQGMKARRTARGLSLSHIPNPNSSARPGPDGVYLCETQKHFPAY